MGRQLSIKNWDYREELGETVEPGQLAARSLEEVGHADVVIGIFGSTIPLPVVTRQELEKAYRRQRDGEDVTVALFLHHPPSSVHRDWIEDLQRRLGTEIVWDPYKSRVDLQRKVYAYLVLTLFPVFARLDTPGPPTGGQA